MPDNTSVPLHVFQVLEEEYINLYGQLAEAGESLDVWLPARRGAEDTGGATIAAEAGGVGMRLVEAARDWSFRRGHLMDAAGLAAEILREESPEVAARQTHLYDEWAKRNLRNRLRELMDGGVLAGCAAPRGGGGEVAAGDGPAAGAEELEAALRKELDRLLDNKALYDCDRFAEVWMAPMVRGLVELHVWEGLEGDDLRQLNRLLLECAYPKFIERIHHIRLAAAYQRIHARRPAALSLSGGGIRSGTFALGLLQGLARHDLLKWFDYLSTVSGGGYTGSWLTAWLHRHPEGLAGVTRELANRSPVSKIDSDPRPVRHLREYSNFLTPKAGLLTADTWTFAGIYLRNLLLNWAILLPLLFAALMVPRLYLAFTLWQPLDEDCPSVVTAPAPDLASGADANGLDAVPERLRLAYRAKTLGEYLTGRPAARDGCAGETPPGATTRLVASRGATRDATVAAAAAAAANLTAAPAAAGAGFTLYPRHLLLLFGFLLGAWGLGYIGFNRPAARGALRERSRFWRERSNQRWFLVCCMLPLVLSAASLSTYWAWSQEAGNQSPKDAFFFLGLGTGFTALGWAISTLVLRRHRHPKEISPAELGGALAAGALGGLLFWLLSRYAIGDPVIGYGVRARAGQIVSRPLAWTDWAGWTWLDWTTELYVCFAVPIFLLVSWAGVTLFVGVTSYSHVIKDEDREWWARFGAWLLIVAGGWAVVCAAVVFGPLALLEFPRLLGAVGGLSGLVAVLAGRSALTPARGEAVDEKDTSRVTAAKRLLGRILPLFGLVFLLALVAGVSLLTTGVTRWAALRAAEFARRAGAGRTAADLSAPGRADGSRPAGGGFAEALTNVPSGEPYGGFGAAEPAGGAGDINTYLEYITPVVPFVVRPVVPAGPLPGATPCAPVCPPPAEAEGERAAHTADLYAGARLVHMNVLHHTSLPFTALLAALSLLLGLALSRLINLNYFSLHAGYRNRLIRAFLGASRPPGQRRPNPFTGFDPADNIHMHELRPALLDEDDILDAGGLARALLDQSNELSSYLAAQGLVETVRAEPDATDSPGLRAALRADLNAVLESESLYDLKFAQKYFAEGAARRIRERVRGDLARAAGEMRRRGGPAEATPRGSYRVLLNRLAVEAAYPGKLAPALLPPPPYRLLHVINTSLNLVGGEKLAWQQRKAEPFSVSPLHAGCFRLGYRRSRVYGGADTGGITIGTAAAVSGAAASSNMGYYTTSPVVSLLLTLFNVRLGWWLGNPGPAGQQTYRLNGPLYSISPLISEAFGLTNDRYKYVHLTDGGHFENLALYEAVLRRCHFVLLSDGAQDRDYRFADLGNAVRKIRIDLGVPIEFPCVDIYGWDEAGERGPGMYWAVGRIRYSCVDTVWDEARKGPVPAPDGIILYVKPALYGDEPRDVLEYRESFPAFPHQSTGDQFFDEPQFESYRALGSFVLDRLCGPGFDPLTLADLLGRARASLEGRCEDDFAKGENAGFLRWLDGLSQAARDQAGGHRAGGPLF